LPRQNQSGLKLKKIVLKYGGVMLITLLTIGVYLTFNGKIDEENIPYLQADGICLSVGNESLLNEKFCSFDFSGIMTDQNFNRNSTFRLKNFRLKKSMDDHVFHFKLQPENGKLSQHSSILLTENTLSTLYNDNIYLYLKKLLI